MKATLYAAFILLGSSLCLGQEMSNGREQFEALKALPFSTNPFFIRQIADSGQFEGNGTEGLKPHFSGYMCQWIGNMNCSEEVTFQCQGSGIIDCTGTCPGDEETLETMMKMIQDPEMAEKFPMIATMQNKTAEAKGGNNSKFLQMLRGCGFEKLIALMSLASGGFGGGEESEITQVDESALSGFGGDYDYDYYEDYYDEEVDEVKEEPIIEKEAETKQKDVVLPDRKQRSMNYTVEISTDGPVRMDVGPDSNIITILKGAPVQPKAHNRYPKDYQSKYKDDEGGEGSRSRRAVHQLAEEVGILRRSFKKAIHVAIDQDQREKRSETKKMKKVDDQLVQELADQMKNMDPMLVRKMRAVTDEMKINPDMEGQVDDNEDKCEVRNLTCVKFPTRNQCSGIAMGGCMTRIQIMSMIFSPRVVLFLLVGIAGLTVAALFFSYFWRNNNGNQANQVGPQNPAAQVNAGPAAPKAAESQGTNGSQEEANPNHEHEQP